MLRCTGHVWSFLDSSQGLEVLFGEKKKKQRFSESYRNLELREKQILGVLVTLHYGFSRNLSA